MYPKTRLKNGRQTGKAQVSLEMAVALISVFIILLGALNFFIWLNQRLILRQRGYDNSRVAALSYVQRAERIAELQSERAALQERLNRLPNIHSSFSHIIQVRAQTQRDINDIDREIRRLNYLQSHSSAATRGDESGYPKLNIFK